MSSAKFDVLRLLTPDARTRLALQDQLDVDEISIEDLNVPADTLRELRNEYGIQTLRDFTRIDLGAHVLRPDVLQAIHCALFYPKHDPGPPCAWETLFERAPLSTYQNFAGHPFHTRFGPVFYRGRLDGTAKVLVVGQDPATDESLSGRILVGTAGQRTQHFLGKIGITSSYLMLNTVLYGIQSSNLTDAVVQDPGITAYRNELFDNAKGSNPGLTLVLAFGSKAQTAVSAWPGRGTLPVVHVYHPTAQTGLAQNWNAHLSEAASHVSPDHTPDTTPYSTTGELPTADIPRSDLPFGTPAWHGSGGSSRSRRGDGPAFESDIIWTAP
ncbi:MAG TPA: uracil-DNA glycosylase family protein [Rubellimicrobium sp.]|nr:uracil-DNA glycosylase family protein [Rubellimicrobium sp.]